MKLPIAISTSALLALSLSGAMLPNTKFKDFDANPQKHVIAITRVADNETEKKMIKAAESAQPDTGKWWNVKDGKAAKVMELKTPYALTSDALDYYAEHIKRYQKKAWAQRFNEPSSKLDYTATIAQKDAFSLDGKDYKDAYVVTLKISFQTSFTDEAFGGCDFQKQRTVVLDAKGNVLAISGDREEQYAMWMM